MNPNETAALALRIKNILNGLTIQDGLKVLAATTAGLTAGMPKEGVLQVFETQAAYLGEMLHERLKDKYGPVP